MIGETLGTCGSEEIDTGNAEIFETTVSVPVVLFFSVPRTLLMHQVHKNGKHKSGYGPTNQTHEVSMAHDV